jgi:regulator of protease activity HflC (stomatin/prohibitin superfamily)
MKLIIKDHERAFLYKNGVFKKMLPPGKHTVWSFLGETTVKVTAEEKLGLPDMNLPVLLRDAEFEKSVAVADVPDDNLAVHFVDGRVNGVLEPGIHAFWNIFKKNTFEMIDITDPESAGKLPVKYMAHMPSKYCVKSDINEGEIGLLFYNGVFQRTLPAGQHFYWTYNTKIAVQTVDTRIQQADVSGQEILTADKVSLRVNFTYSFQVTDPVSIAGKLKDYKTQLHVMTQLVLREFTGKYRFDDLLRQKDSIGGFILEKLKEREEEFFVKFSDAGVKDIILPGEIRDIMNTVLVAEKSAQASVITRREEIAATKSLLDTAKLMDESATLFKLKEMEYIERICDKVGIISVDGGASILKSLRELIASRT